MIETFMLGKTREHLPSMKNQGLEKRNHSVTSAIALGSANWISGGEWLR